MRGRDVIALSGRHCVNEAVGVGQVERPGSDTRLPENALNCIAGTGAVPQCGVKRARHVGHKPRL